jgi:hypothetical protein
MSKENEGSNAETAEDAERAERTEETTGALKLVESGWQALGAEFQIGNCWCTPQQFS